MSTEDKQNHPPPGAREGAGPGEGLWGNLEITIHVPVEVALGSDEQFLAFLQEQRESHVARYGDRLQGATVALIFPPQYLEGIIARVQEGAAP